MERVDEATADAYFATRSRDSQLGAWASDQSRPLANRDRLMARFEEMREKFDGDAVPRPPHWGGYRVVPLLIEFWQDREFRLHQRWLFRRSASGWDERLLYP